MMTGEQVKAARELLGWSIMDLARRSDVHRFLIFAFEIGQGRLERDAAQIKGTLERAGIEFTNAGEPGVRLSRVSRFDRHEDEPEDSD